MRVAYSSVPPFRRGPSWEKKLSSRIDHTCSIMARMLNVIVSTVTATPDLFDPLVDAVTSPRMRDKLKIGREPGQRACKSSGESPPRVILKGKQKPVSWIRILGGQRSSEVRGSEQDARRAMVSCHTVSAGPSVHMTALVFGASHSSTS